LFFPFLKKITFFFIGDDATATGIGIASSAHPCSSSVEHASCSIFNDEDEDQYDMY
jgi:hypothetical protein